MTTNTRRIHNAQASLPWTEEELAIARDLAALPIAPVAEIRAKLPNRNMSAVKTKLYSIRCGRSNTMSSIRIQNAVALDPNDPGIEDKDFDRFADDAKRGSDKLLSALERAGLVPA